MAIKFEKIQAGMTLWSRGTQQGQYGGRASCEWAVVIKEVCPETRCALVSWNGNAPQMWNEYRLTRLYTRRIKKKETA